jgi:hypothetical protein
VTNVEHMLDLTRQALDEFESVPLAASLRRALRIARLRGDIHYVHMFQLDLGTHGGSTVWRRTEAFELLKSEEISTVDVDWWRSQINEEWMKERTPSKVHELLKDAFGDSDLIGGSIESIIRNSAALERESALASQPRQKYRLELRRELDQEIIERTTHRVFTYLCTVERELSYIGVNADIFERHRLRVESFLSQISPRVLEQFTAAYRRAREDDAESKTHALTTCRRILESVADVVFPPQAETSRGFNGKAQEGRSRELRQPPVDVPGRIHVSKHPLRAPARHAPRLRLPHRQGLLAGEQGGAQRGGPSGSRHVRPADLPVGG